jgi:hypothetical protein
LPLGRHSEDGNLSLTIDQLCPDAGAATKPSSPAVMARFSAGTSKQQICRSEKSLSFELIIAALN